MKRCIRSLALALAARPAPGRPRRDRAHHLLERAARARSTRRPSATAAKARPCPATPWCARNAPSRSRRAATLLRVDDVPALIDPTTVAFASLTRSARHARGRAELRVRPHQHRRSCSRATSTARSRSSSRAARASRRITGTLVGTQGGLILQAARRQRAHRARALGRASCRACRAASSASPRSSGTSRPPTRARRSTRFAYQTGGMTWWTDYNLTYSEPRPGRCQRGRRRLGHDREPVGRGASPTRG